MTVSASHFFIVREVKAPERLELRWKPRPPLPGRLCSYYYIHLYLSLFQKVLRWWVYKETFSVSFNVTCK